jgi:hypothetical protein
MWLIEALKSNGTSADKVKPDILQAMMWGKESWNQLSQQTIINCWNHVEILPMPVQHPVIESPVIETNVLDELQNLLLEFLKAADMPDIFGVEDMVNILAELWTESPDSDDEASDLAIALTECPKPSGDDAVEDDVLS